MGEVQDSHNTQTYTRGGSPEVWKFSEVLLCFNFEHFSHLTLNLIRTLYCMQGGTVQYRAAATTLSSKDWFGRSSMG